MDLTRLPEGSALKLFADVTQGRVKPEHLSQKLDDLEKRKGAQKQQQQRDLDLHMLLLQRYTSHQRCLWDDYYEIERNCYKRPIYKETLNQQRENLFDAIMLYDEQIKKQVASLNQWAATAKSL